MSTFSYAETATRESVADRRVKAGEAPCGFSARSSR